MSSTADPRTGPLPLDSSLCPHCYYDVERTLADGLRECPECGHDLSCGVARRVPVPRATRVLFAVLIASPTMFWALSVLVMTRSWWGFPENREFAYPCVYAILGPPFIAFAAYYMLFGYRRTGNRLFAAAIAALATWPFSCSATLIVHVAIYWLDMLFWFPWPRIPP